MNEHQNLTSTQNLQESSGDGGVSDPLPPTAKIGRYTILRRVGKGGFGQALLAYDEDLDRSVAIKVPRPERVSHDLYIDSGDARADAYVSSASSLHPSGAKF